MQNARLALILCSLLVVSAVALMTVHAPEAARAGMDDKSVQQHAPDDSPGRSALAIFERRILPIFRAKSPSSCTECHLSGVDLKDYIHPDQATTFASLVAAGLVDAKRPEDSKLLEFIARKPEKPSLVTDKAREQEYDAFR